MIKKIFRWIFADELRNLNSQITKSKNLGIELQREKERLQGFFDISVDVHEYGHNPISRSWAVVSVQGEKSDYIKFIDLGPREVKDIKQFLQNFERSSNIKIDASPPTTTWLRFDR